MSKEKTVGKIKIRKATLKDAKRIGKVLNCSYNICSKAEGAGAFLNEAKKGYVFIVAVKETKKRKEIIGIISYIARGLPKHGLAELDRVAVLPEYRGKGIGKLLYLGLVGTLKKEYRKSKSKLRKLYLLTHADNRVAHTFYKSMGLKYETTLKSHYYKNRDDLVFSTFFD